MPAPATSAKDQRVLPVMSANDQRRLSASVTSAEDQRGLPALVTSAKDQRRLSAPVEDQRGLPVTSAEDQRGLPAPATSAEDQREMPSHEDCDGPLLPEADPPCSEGVDSAATSNPEVQHTSDNPRLRLGNERQRETFCAVTRLQNSEGSDESGADEWRTLSWGTVKEDGDDMEGSGVLTTDDPKGDPPDDWKTRTSGAGGAQRKLRPRWVKPWPLQVRGLHK
ncbi:hypothetical protein NDU88_008359 [Pleurodeles waltl]|uniref:Uncharacterized protein n=1 Tax=Pleurodeles waltl TaxID=8319 RepID=A0AAV7N4Q6_PLEWA|nr:hypothetical protein NDU88_008359 [Pleurodeles waltl]